MKVFDKAKWHTEGELPVGVDAAQSYVHTGYFLGWLADHNLLSDEIEHDFASDIAAFKRRAMSGPTLFRRVDGVLSEDMLSPTGARFASDYFDLESGLYIRDYESVLAKDLPSIYEVPDSWENYRTISDRIDERYADWTRTNQASE